MCTVDTFLFLFYLHEYILYEHFLEMAVMNSSLLQIKKNVFHQKVIFSFLRENIIMLLFIVDPFSEEIVLRRLRLYFFRSQLIWIYTVFYTVFKRSTYPSSAVPGLRFLYFLLQHTFRIDWPSMFGTCQVVK